MVGAFREAPYTVLATVSDGEKAVLAALEQCWPAAGRQAHFLNNLTEPLLALDTQLRQQMRNDLGGLPAVPEQAEEAMEKGGEKEERPPFHSPGAPPAMTR